LYVQESLGTGELRLLAQPLLEASWGLDAAFPAAFVALLVPHVVTRAGKVTALIGAVIALVAVPVTPAGAPILLAALAVGPGLVVAARRKSL